MKAFLGLTAVLCAVVVWPAQSFAAPDQNGWQLYGKINPKGLNFDVTCFPAVDPETGKAESHSKRISARIAVNGGRGFSLDDLLDPSYTQDAAQASPYWGSLLSSYKAYVHRTYAGYEIQGWMGERQASHPTQGLMYFSHLGPRHYKPGTGDVREPLVYYALRVKMDGEWVPIPLREEIHYKPIGQTDLKFTVRQYFLVVRAARCGNVYPTVAAFDTVVVLPRTMFEKRIIEESVTEVVKWRTKVENHEIEVPASIAPQAQVTYNLNLPTVIMTNPVGQAVSVAPNQVTAVVPMGSFSFNMYARENIFIAVSTNASASASATATSSSSSSSSGGNGCSGGPPDLPGTTPGGTTPPTTPPNNPPVPGGTGSGNSDINPPSLPPGSVSTTPDPNR